MFVHVASVDPDGEGMQFFVAFTREALDQEIAKYCIDQWHNVFPDEEPPNLDSSKPEEIIDDFFSVDSDYFIYRPYEGVVGVVR